MSSSDSNILQESLINRHKMSFFIVSVLLLNLLLRGFYLGSNPIDLDEPFSIFYAQMDVSEIITALKVGNNPPLYEIFLHFWVKIFGISPVSVRFPSLIFSVITIYFVYLICKQFLNQRVAILAVLLLTFSNFHLYFSHEARVYSVFTLLTTISFYLFLIVLQKKNDFQLFAALFLTYLFLVFSHYFGIVVVLMQAALLLFLRFDARETLRKYFIVLAVLAAVFAFYIPVVIGRFSDSSVNGTWIEPVESLGNLFNPVFWFTNENRWIFLLVISLLWLCAWKIVSRTIEKKVLKIALLYVLIPSFFLISYSLYFPVPFVWRLTSMPVFIGFFLFSISSVWLYFAILNRRKADSELLVTAWFLIPLVGFFTISFVIPIFHYRYLVFILPAFYIVLSLAVNHISSGKLPFVIISAGLLLCMILRFEPNHSNNRFSDELMLWTKKWKTTETKVVFSPEHYKFTFAYHYDRSIFNNYKNLKTNLEREKVFTEKTSEDLQTVEKSTDKLIFIDVSLQGAKSENEILSQLRKTFMLKDKKAFPDSSAVYLFHRR